MIQYRQQMNKRLDAMYNDKVSPIKDVDILTTGGKGEGTAKYFESDIDRLYTHREVVCVTTKDVIDAKEYVYKGSPMTIFRSRPEGCAPGYTRLERIRICKKEHADTINTSLVEEDGRVYIRNDLPKIKRQSMIYDVNGMQVNQNTRSGPSLCSSNSDISYDFVLGCVYDSRHHLKEWARRTCRFDWPSDELIKEVLNTRGHVVPVASKNNSFLETEWRICYTEAELLLVKSMNEVQLKIYILLKLVSKSVLRPISKELSSYVNKNLIFWMSEKYPLSYFTIDKLFPRFCEALCILRDSLTEGKLFSFIIAERNLLEGRISESQCKKLADSIDRMISADTNLFLDMKIGKALNMLKTAPEDLKEMSRIRDEAEDLVLKRNLAFKRIEVDRHYVKKGLGMLPKVLENDEEYKRIGECLIKLVLPKKYRLEQEETGVNTSELLKQKLIEILS